MWKVYPLISVLILLLSAGRSGTQAQDNPADGETAPRLKTSLNEDWQFRFDDSNGNSWEQVTLPHTWNAKDAFDETPGYRRTVGWYRKNLNLRPRPDKKYVLLFEAANQKAEVYINGRLAGSHKGGYTAFTVDVTPYLKAKQTNELRVKVDNRHDEDIPPLKGDFNFYGGIYRDVWLLELNKIHFDPGDYASTGIFVTTPEVSETSASVKIEGFIKNEIESEGVEKISVRNRLMDQQNREVVVQEKQLEPGSESLSFTETFESIKEPKLWHPDHPYLYTLETEIRRKDRVMDRITTPVGFRWFRFDVDSGFYLNGERLKLMGVNRHQDYQGKGNALGNARHVADVKLAKESGSNFLRTAHYPQDPAVLEACDRIGLLVSMEISLDHEITDSPEFYRNTIRMQREMIRQYYNHPSIIIRAYMNEMLLGRSWERDRGHIQKITDFARELEAVTRKEDPTRYTMIPNHGAFDIYHKAGLTDIPMLVGWNLYYGWYESELEGLGRFLDHHHKMLPDKPTIITEYGAGSDPRIRSREPLRFDFSIEWQNRFLQSNLRQITERSFVAGAAVWNLFDFGSESRRDAVPTINSKGLMTFDRKPKDSYYLLQSWLKDEPFVRIGSREWTKRIGKASPKTPDVSVQTVQVYGNTGSAELLLNGESLGVENLENHIAEWEVPFQQGRNLLQAKAESGGKTIRDHGIIDVNIYPFSPADTAGEFNDIYINAGSNFYFVDEADGIVWHPDTPYESGYWGFQGGEFYKPRNRGIGTDAAISGTDRDPLYQTQRVGIDRYRFDVPPGTYEVELHFAELSDEEDADKVSFDVLINGKLILDNLGLGSQFGSRRAVIRKIVTNIGNEGLKILFKPAEGQVVINAIGIRKIK